MAVLGIYLALMVIFFRKGLLGTGPWMVDGDKEND